MTESESDPALSLATADQICAELARRYAGIVVVVERADDVESMSLWYHGGVSKSLGMMQRAGTALRRKVRGCAGEGDGN